MQPSRRADQDVVLYGYQSTGHEWLADQTAGMLADEMGLGKTVQAIRAADSLQLRNLLIVVPAVALYNWQAEVWRFSLFERNVQVIATGRDRVQPDATVVVVTHTLITKPAVRAQLVARTWDVVIVDEADAFKTATAQRTVALYGTGCCRAPGCVAAAADRVWTLTGTPAPNHAGELWTHLRALRPETITDPNTGRPYSYHAFLYRYCLVKATRYGPQVLGNNPRHVEELKARALRPFILRRMKRDVLPDLPPIAFDVTVLAPDHVPAEVTQLEAELGEELVAILETCEDEREVYRRLEKHEESMSRLRRWMGMLKVTPTIELLRHHFEQKPGAKVVLFAHHRDVIDRFMAEAKVVGWGAVKVDGSVGSKPKFDAVERFQNDPDCVLFVGQLQAASTAVTLTASSDVMFAEASWTPRDNQQAAARAHRISQTDPVRVQFLSLAGSIDEAVAGVLARKVRALRELYA